MLVPLDFSRASIKALDYAVALARQFGARVSLVHVCDYDAAPPILEMTSLDIPIGEVMRQAKHRLRELSAKYGTQLTNAQLHVVSGRAYHEVCRLARRLGVDLLVTATRGHTGLKHLLLGSTAERLVQHAPCPVLIVRRHEREWVDRRGFAISLGKILVPLDFSECSLAGLEFAIPFAHFWKARLVLFNCVPLTSFAPYGEFGARSLPSLSGRAYDVAEEWMQKICAKILPRGVAVETVVMTGPAARQACAYAQEHDVDLILTSTHGVTGIAHTLIGSTAEHITRYAHCPVLVVPTRWKGKQGRERN